MNEGEKQAVLRQFTVLVNATEAKLRAIGLTHVRLYTVDMRTGEPVLNLDQLVWMAEGKCACGTTDDEHHENGCRVVAKRRLEASLAARAASAGVGAADPADVGPVPGPEGEERPGE